MNLDWLDLAVYLWLGCGLVAFPFLMRITAPYGRHTTATFGPVMSNRWGWTLMERPVLVLFVYFVLTGTAEKTAVFWVIFGLFVSHYLHRSLIFPWRTHTQGKVIPVAIVFAAVVFNLINGSINGLWLGNFRDYPLTWFKDMRFVGGTILFLSGAIINFKADETLIGLRRPGETGYKIPYGGLFEQISCPNLFGEMVQWWGFALLCWNPAALSFAVWTTVNLVPRAKDHHRWYRRTFPDYPEKRKIILPRIW